MAAYAVANLRNLNYGADIAAYVKKIDATLEPFGGRFLVHGGRTEALEGDWPHLLVVLEFPDMDRARAWYESPAYQEILKLRTDNSEGEVALVQGVPDGYRATMVLEKIGLA